MISRIFWPRRVPRWASCRSSWPSPTWQKPYFVAMFLHCVPLPQPGPPITKMIRGDLSMSAVTKEERGRGVGAGRGQWALMRLCPQLSACPGHRPAGIPTFALGWHLRVCPGPLVYPGMACISAAVGSVGDINLSRLGPLYTASPGSVTMTLTTQFTVQETEAQTGAGPSPRLISYHPSLPSLRSSLQWWPGLFVP